MGELRLARPVAEAGESRGQARLAGSGPVLSLALGAVGRPIVRADPQLGTPAVGVDRQDGKRTCAAPRLVRDDRRGRLRPAPS